MNKQSTIEGCIRQSTNNPVKPGWRLYVDDEMLLFSSTTCDHEFMRHKMMKPDHKYMYEEYTTVQPRGEETVETSDSSL